MTTAPKNIYQRINAVMAAVRGVGKDSHNPHGKYKYAGHEAVTSALRDHYVAQGIVRHSSVLSCTEQGGVVMVNVRVSFVNVDDTSDRIELDAPAIQPPQTTAKTPTAQQVGQAISYAVKNVEFKLFALTGDDEPDSDSQPIEPAQERTGAPAQAHETSEQNKAAHVRAAALLAKFPLANTQYGVTAINDEIKAEWANLKAVVGLAEKISDARNLARNRIKDAAAAFADPEKDGR